MNKFTDLKIRNLPLKGKPYDLREGHGFGIRVFPSGKKTWFYFHTFNGQKKRLNLGPYPEVTLAIARARHREAQTLVGRGEDPSAIRQDLINAPTVEDLVEEYLKKWAKPNKRSWKEDERNLRKDVVPVWRRRKAKDIKRRDVILLLESIIDRGAPRQSNIVFSVIRRMFNFAVERDILEYSPCSNVKPLAKENAKDRCLTQEEIKTFWDGLATSPISDNIKRALKLILVTAQRPGEVIGAHWSEFEGNWWTIPADRAKNGKPHRIPLPSLAIDLFGPPGEGHLFPSPRGDKPVHVNALAHALRRALKPDEKTGQPILPIAHFTPHDLRRTAASHMTGARIPRLVVSKILNHVDNDITAVYDRHSYEQEKNEALEAWERKLRGILSGKQPDNVIPLRANGTPSQK